MMSVLNSLLVSNFPPSFLKMALTIIVTIKIGRKEKGEGQNSIIPSFLSLGEVGRAALGFPPTPVRYKIEKRNGDSVFLSLILAVIDYLGICLVSSSFVVF